MGSVAQAMLGASELADRSSGKVISALDTLAASRLKQGEMSENRRRSIIQEGHTDTQLNQMERRITQEDEQLQEGRRRNLADEELRQKELEESARTRESRETLGIMQLQAQMFETSLKWQDEVSKIEDSIAKGTKESILSDMSNFFQRSSIYAGSAAATEEESGEASPYVTSSVFDEMLKNYAKKFTPSNIDEFKVESASYISAVNKWQSLRMNGFINKKTGRVISEEDFIDTIEADKKVFPEDSPYRQALDTIYIQMKREAAPLRGTLLTAGLNRVKDRNVEPLKTKATRYPIGQASGN